MPTPDARLLLASLQSSADIVDRIAKTTHDTIRSSLNGTGLIESQIHPASRSAIPRWHFSMLNDEYRNAALERALKEQVRPGQHVFEIGCGAGLLALMSARAGAERVTTCEADPLLAEIARLIIDEHGYSDVIKVIPKASTEIVLGEDIDTPPDLIISEIIDCGFVGEGIVPSLVHARQHLLSPSGNVLPQSARLYGQLVDSAEAVKLNQVLSPSGFDLRLLNLVARAGHFEVCSKTLDYDGLTEPSHLLSFDFSSPELTDNSRAVVALPVSYSGNAHALLVWFEVDYGHEHLTNRPHGPSTHWNQACVLLPSYFSVHQGDRLFLTISWENQSLTVTEVQRTRP